VSTNRKQITRRDFLRGAGSLALVAPMAALARAGEPQPSVPPAPSPNRARVVLVRHKEALKPDGKPNAPAIGQMLDDAVAALFGERDPASAWKKIVLPSDTVGIKTNRWQFVPTTTEVEEALRRRVMDAGVPAERIAIDDRGVLGNPVFQKATALINARPMRTHHWAGVGSLLKNYIMFVPEPSAWHGDSCADLGGIWHLPIVKDKTRLNVLVMLTPLFQSKGPHDFSAQYTWRYSGLLVGIDPVATDATGLRILQAKRREFFGADQPFEVPPKHIEVADRKFGLGVADPARIDLIKLGWSEGALI
jgi:hypothetical protein